MCMIYVNLCLAQSVAHFDVLCLGLETAGVPLFKADRGSPHRQSPRNWLFRLFRLLLCSYLPAYAKVICNNTHDKKLLLPLYSNETR